MRVVDVSGWVASHFKSQSNIVYSLWLWRTKTNTGDPDLHVYCLFEICDFLSIIKI